MSNRRIIQHREKRDTSNRERAELKKENQQLRRQVARLRKKIIEAEEIREVASDEEEVVAPLKPICPRCASTDLGEIKTPNGKTVVSCRSCRGWRSVTS